MHDHIMPNQPPVAVLTVSATSISLPLDIIHLSLKNSYDFTNLSKTKPGVIVSWEFSKISGPACEFINLSNGGKDCDFHATGGVGTYVVQGKVTDKGGLVGTMNETLVVKGAKVHTGFGASGPDVSGSSIDDSLNRLQTLVGNAFFPAKTVTRRETIVTDYDGSGCPDNGVLQIATAGVHIFWNINFDHVDKSASGGKLPNPFVTDLVMYRSKIRPILRWFQTNHPELQQYIIPVCENEPTTGAFHSGPMSDYLALLGVFVEECQSAGYTKFTDGGIHVDNILGVDLVTLTGEGSAQQVADLMAGYANIPLWRVCIHTSNTSATNFPVDKIPQAVQAVLDVTGHASVSNEWHVQDWQGVPPAMQILVNMMTGWANAHVDFSVYISGTSDKNKGLIDSGGSLTTYGQKYHDTIPLLQNV